ncbi:MAG TPA: hypothetical protein VHY35_12800 [Stellaceae bacterium]|nr:hypothetical protein [Stellaceae bacterium]
MPSSIDTPMNSTIDHAMNTPMGFRRERFWFLNFVMTPFKDVDKRATEDTTERKPRSRSSR